MIIAKYSIETYLKLLDVSDFSDKMERFLCYYNLTEQYMQRMAERSQIKTTCMLFCKITTT